MSFIKRFILIVTFSISTIKLSAGNDFCGVTNFSFSTGEVITFKIFYNVIGLYVDAGTASFTVSNTKLNNKPVYHIVGLGTSNPSYDWIF
ncbi:MAG: hypothetical protein RL253_125, partial [Bacteroidota bacterium]